MKEQSNKIRTGTSLAMNFFADLEPYHWVKEKITNGHYTVLEITAEEANDVVIKFHYSGKVVPNSSLHLGILDQDKNLCGCLSFGPSMNQKSTPQKFTDAEGMFELNRMVMDDNQPRNSESQAIGLCVRWLKKYRKDIKWLLSFSDGKEGNVGYIYQATNWVYLGYLLSDSFYDLDGAIMHNVSVWHKYKEKHPDRDVKTTDEILCDNFTNISKLLSKQHVYVFPLHHRVAFKQERKPYPKLETEVPILRRTWIKRDGSVLPEKLTENFTNEELQGI